MSVSALVVGAGASDPYVFSCGLDHKLSVRTLVSGRLLASVSLPSPLTCIAVDPLEYCAYLGSNNGCCYKVSFVGEEMMTLRSNTGQVTCMALSKSGQHLVMGTEDGSVLLWDTLTGQQIRKTVIDHQQAVAVSAVLVLASPLGLACRGRGRKPDDARPQPLSNFAKVVGSSGCPGLKPWQNSLVTLTGACTGSRHGETGEGAGAGRIRASAGNPTAVPCDPSSLHNKLAARIAQLEKENELLLEQKNRALSLLPDIDGLNMKEP